MGNACAMACQYNPYTSNAAPTYVGRKEGIQVIMSSPYVRAGSQPDGAMPGINAILSQDATTMRIHIKLTCRKLEDYQLNILSGKETSMKLVGYIIFPRNVLRQQLCVSED
ncbi:hypothetical protein CDAR_286271 [Caerostris darwini]|uniref:Uncharacterized protein n=1 Tax=Caerostris darwini TaxID=1538125 RepID=A0AAV4W174_9ARAC|nr:hypothetical protein CDAR_286271 [Caerostris darwini]